MNVFAGVKKLNTSSDNKKCCLVKRFMLVFVTRDNFTKCRIRVDVP